MLCIVTYFARIIKHYFIASPNWRFAVDEIKRQVQKARRRLNLREFLQIVVWSLSLALLVALLGLAAPRMWFLDVQPEVWTWSWIGGGCAVGLLSGWLFAFLRRRGDLQAAIELDHRFGLKERVSSSLSLSGVERETEFGQALLHDAQRRIERIDLREHFQLGLGWKSLFPLVPALGMFALLFFVPHATQQLAASSDSVGEEKARVKKAMAELEKKFTEKKVSLKEKDLKEGDPSLQDLLKSPEKLKGKEIESQKEALVKLNDLMKEAAKRRNELGPTEELKKQLEDLKKLEQGPAEKMANALREGDIAQAAQEMKKLIDKLNKGELGKEDQKKLADQLDQVKEKIEKMQQEHEQQKQQLKEEIEKQKNQGNAAEAAKLQEKLDKMQAQDQQMKNGMQKMAEKMGQAAQKLREGNDGQAAAGEMQQIADDLKAMQDQLNEMESLDEAMNEIQDAKNAMNCKKCNGDGCKACQGQGAGKGQGDQPGRGLGEGKGMGERPEEENATKGYDSRVRAKPQKGKAVRVGDAGGANIAGRAKDSLKEEVAASLAKEPDPIDDSALPRDQREHSKEYFEKLLKGE